MVKILLIEDNPADARFIRELLLESKLTHELTAAESLQQGLQLLSQETFDVLLTDLGLPDSQGLETFKQIHEHAHNIPTIVLTGLDDEEVSVKAVHEGAQDYLVKGMFGSRVLSKAIRYAIERQKLLNEIKMLRGILPICSYCKKIRNDKGYWEQLEMYITEHSGALFSHGMCPACAEKVMKEFEELTKKGKES